jgi:hypothetical protein
MNRILLDANLLREQLPVFRLFSVNYPQNVFATTQKTLYREASERIFELNCETSFFIEEVCLKLGVLENKPYQNIHENKSTSGLDLKQVLMLKFSLQNRLD